MLKDEDILKCLIRIIDIEKVNYTDDGLKAIISNAQGDMRHAVNDLQAVYSTFVIVNAENVYKISDEPHPALIRSMITKCLSDDYYGSFDILCSLISKGYMPEDLISTIGRAVQNLDQPEYIILECLKIVGSAQVRISKGSSTKLQLGRVLAAIYSMTKDDKLSIPL
ncbi:MAG: Subunit of heteropentameric Replication factor C (RF-C) [Paramarteilia canceri]